MSLNVAESSASHMNKAEKLKSIMLEVAGANGTPRKDYVARDSHSAADPRRFFQKNPRLYAFIKDLISPTLSWYRWQDHVADPSLHVVLNLGSGATVLHPDLVNVDFVSFPQVDIVADFSQRLPIRDESVDGVITISVMEHLDNPEAVVAEVARILRPGGTFHIAAPFLYPYHGAPDDFTRWTLSGLERLLGDSFEIQSSGSRGGPSGVVILGLSHMTAQVMSLLSPRLYHLTNFGMLAALSPLKLLDLAFSRLPLNTMLATGLYVTGVKRKPTAG